MLQDKKREMRDSQMTGKLAEDPDKIKLTKEQVKEMFKIGKKYNYLRTI